MSDLRNRFEAWADAYGFDKSRFVRPETGPENKYAGQHQDEILQFAWEAVKHIYLTDPARIRSDIDDGNKKRAAESLVFNAIFDGYSRGNHE